MIAIHTPSPVSPVYMRMWASDQKLSMPTRLLWRRPSRKRAKRVKPARPIVTASSPSVAEGLGLPVTRTLGSQLANV